MGAVVPDLEVGGRGDRRHFCCLVRVPLNLNAVIEWGGVGWGGSSGFLVKREFGLGRALTLTRSLPVPSGRPRLCDGRRGVRGG